VEEQLIISSIDDYLLDFEADVIEYILEDVERPLNLEK
jgi:hypothetical protein